MTVENSSGHLQSAPPSSHPRSNSFGDLPSPPTALPSAESKGDPRTSSRMTAGGARVTLLPSGHPRSDSFGELPSHPKKEGGRVKIEGKFITLDQNSTINASGSTTGGRILIGGDFQGNLEKHAFKGEPGKLAPHSDFTINAKDNAHKVTVEEGAKITATGASEGGQLVIWSGQNTSDGSTTYMNATADLSSKTGQGGAFEVSSKGQVILPTGTLQLDTKGPLGQGLRLIDPAHLVFSSSGIATITAPWTGGNITLSGNAISPTSGMFSSNSSGSTTVSWMNPSNVQAGDTYTVDGWIVVASAISTIAGDLTLIANQGIQVNANITTTSNSGTITLTSSTGSITGTGTISADGNLNLSAGGNIGASGSALNVSDANGSIAITSGGDTTLTSDSTSMALTTVNVGGALSLTTTSGANITFQSGATAGSITLNSDNTINASGILKATSGTISLSAQNGIGSSAPVYLQGTLGTISDNANSNNINIVLNYTGDQTLTQNSGAGINYDTIISSVSSANTALQTIGVMTTGTLTIGGGD